MATNIFERNKWLIDYVTKAAQSIGPEGPTGETGVMGPTGPSGGPIGPQGNQGNDAKDACRGRRLSSISQTRS